MKKCVLFFVSVFPLIANITFAQETREQQAKKTEVWSPVPPVIIPSDKPGGAPSDAIILFNGESLSEWVSTKDTTKPAGWIVSGDVFMVNKPAGSIQTKKKIYRLPASCRMAHSNQYNGFWAGEGKQRNIFGRLGYG